MTLGEVVYGPLTVCPCGATIRGPAFAPAASAGGRLHCSGACARERNPGAEIFERPMLVLEPMLDPGPLRTGRGRI